MPTLLQNVTPRTSEEAVCKKLYFEIDKMQLATETVGKLGDFIQAHIPEGEGSKCPINDILLWLKQSDDTLVHNAGEIIMKICSNPEKWDV